MNKKTNYFKKSKEFEQNKKENELIMKGYQLGYQAGLMENLKNYTYNEIRTMFGINN